MQPSEFDYILVGGGLQSGLLFLALQHQQPDLRVLMLEAGQTLGGNHTWSYHPGDVPTDTKVWMEPLAQYRWTGYDVRFPGFQRRVHLDYASLTSDHFADVITAGFDKQKALERTVKQSNESVLMTAMQVVRVDETAVTTGDGAVYHARAVIDCRGPSRELQSAANVGFQKFVGLEVELACDWPAKFPTLMDACRPQLDGFQFIYSLPFTQRRLLVEDTCFSERSEIDREGCMRRIHEYLLQHVGTNWQIVREESGCLPMPYSSIYKPSATRPLSGGYSGGWFHAATGYSFPLAVRFAKAVASVPPEQACHAVAKLADEHRWRAGYARLLNRLLYRLVRPETRWQIFRRFYRVLSDESIARFYCHEFNSMDAFRIVFGIPPAGLTPIRFLRTPRLSHVH